jgi:AcrR family transcriptional regulator
MAYRKTEKVLAQLEARRASIIASAIDVISKHGLEGLTTDSVAARAGIAVGLIYKYFPDKTELLAAVVAQLLDRDRAAMKEAESLAEAIGTLFHRAATNYRLMSTISQLPAYREGMKRELARLIRATDPTEIAGLLSAVVYGAIFEAAALGPRFEKELTTAVRRALGVSSKAKAAV